MISKTRKVSGTRAIMLKVFYYFSYIFRKKRLTTFKRFTSDIKKPIKILDVGGTVWFWYGMGYINNPDYKITLLNLFKQRVFGNNIKAVVGNGKKMSFRDKSFDVVFSNSTIEHLEELGEQQKFAQEIQRVGKKFFVQTPNKYFPIEPHFLIPFFFLIPKKIQPFIIKSLSVKWKGKYKNDFEFAKAIGKIRLLTEKEIKVLFPQAKILKEKLLCLPKSFIILG